MTFWWFERERGVCYRFCSFWILIWREDSELLAVGLCFDPTVDRVFLNKKDNVPI